MFHHGPDGAHHAGPGGLIGCARCEVMLGDGNEGTGKLRVIQTRAQLTELARELKVGPEWHEPDQVDVDAVTGGRDLDNAFTTPVPDFEHTDAEPLYVVIRHQKRPVAYVNMAMLLAWATGFEDE